MGWLTQKKVIIKLSFYVSQPILYSPSCIIVVIGRQVEQHRGSISRYLYEIRCQVREVIISILDTGSRPFAAFSSARVLLYLNMRR